MWSVRVISRRVGTQNRNRFLEERGETQKITAVRGRRVDHLVINISRADHRIGELTAVFR